MDFQFYATYPELGRRAWMKFKNDDFVRMLEASAGNGDLALANPWKYAWNDPRGRIKIDCCEIDVSRHATLRDHGFNVVGMDFLQFGNGAIYSHILMNPPFAEGAKHVLKAWDILWDGEIVAIINAETVRNPFSRERELLVSLIERHGEVEFIEDAFSVPEAERKAEVDVALVYLRKQANVGEDIVGDLLRELRQDTATAGNLAGEYREQHDLALPNSYVENSVLAFNAAVRAMRDSVFSEARARYYASLLGETMAVRNGKGGSTTADTSVAFVQQAIGKEYDDLKDRAWAGILRSTNVTSRLSSSGQKRVESEFESIKKLEFTVPNIYGFLCGLVESQGKLQIEMACDVFDLITRYHTDNTVFYKGWKSNDKHRTAGMRIKTTRFVLPGHQTESHQTSLPWDSERVLSDFDKVFAMLDGKREPEVSMVGAFRANFRSLRNGGRVSSSYFDLRHYPGVGTIHFFPRDKSLVDRLNRLVGRHRQWLPPEGTRVSDAFWLQFDKAEKFDKEVRTEINKGTRSWWEHPLNHLFSREESKRVKAFEAVDDAATRVLERHGISVEYQIEEQPQQRPLLAA